MGLNLGNSAVIRQHAVFAGGTLDMRTGLVAFARPFLRGTKLAIDGEIYVVRDGPIAEAVEKSQQPMENCIIVLVPFAEQKESVDALTSPAHID